MPPISAENANKVRRVYNYLDGLDDLAYRVYKKIIFVADTSEKEPAIYIWTETILAKWWNQACDWLADHPDGKIEDGLDECWPASIDAEPDEKDDKGTTENVAETMPA